MAVVSGGYFGEYFSNYQSLSDSRYWNTKNYDLAILKNKGDIAEDLTNETTGAAATGAAYGTGLLVKTNKNGTIDSSGRFISDRLNPFYQVRDNQDNVDYNYYVDQETGNVYFRPTATAGATVPVGATNVTGISLPNYSDIKTYTPQYFGTTFSLDQVPNPEDWGAGGTVANPKSNLAYIFQNLSTLAGGAVPGGSPAPYSDIEVNGVKISSSSLDTSLINAIPPTALMTGTVQGSPLYQFTDAFTTGATDFTSVSPASRWQAIGTQRSWPGATTPPAGFVTSDAMWYPDATDSDFAKRAATSNVGLQSVLFRTKLDLAVPLGSPINVSLGSDSGSVEFFLNGKLETAVAGVVTIPAIDFKVGENIIGIHAIDVGSGNEGVYVKMATTDVQALGYDISSTTTSWESAKGYPLAVASTTSAIGANPNEANRLFGDNWTYVPPTTPTGVGSYNTTSFCLTEDPANPKSITKQSYFNQRPVDNFIMSTDMSLASVDFPSSYNPVGSGSYDAWSGVRIRAAKPDDLPSQSGYTVRWNKNGKIELYKAYAQNHPVPVPPPMDGDLNVVATANTTALSTTPHNLEVHANGSNIKVYVDGALAINYNDNQDFYYQEGYSGFVSHGNFTSYQNFQLYSYAQPIQLLSRALQKGENTIVIKGFAQDNVGNPLLGQAAVSGVVANSKIYKGALTNIDLSTNNIPPNLAPVVTKGAIDNTYKASINEDLTGGPYNYSLDPRKAYWSASSVSIDGIAGKIQFKPREGGDLQKTKDQFMGQNNLMSNLTSLLAAEDDLFNSHLNIIK